jgi:hypothetical protein
MMVSMAMPLATILKSSEASARDIAKANDGKLLSPGGYDGRADDVGRTPCRDGQGRWLGPSIVLEKIDSNKEYLFHKFVFNLGSATGCVLNPADAVFSLYRDDQKVFDITSILREGVREPWISWFLISDCSKNESEKRGGGHACVLLRINREAFFKGTPPASGLSIEVEEDGKKYSPLKLKIKSK